jgi:SulP family sulfate permease
MSSSAKEAVNVVRKSTWKDVGRAVVLEPLSNIPAVVLGLMLNVLDGVSYGMIT